MERDPDFDTDHVVRHRTSGSECWSTEMIAWPKRRAFLQALAAQGVSIPASYLLFGDNARAATLNKRAASQRQGCPATGRRRADHPRFLRSLYRTDQTAS
jgi:hypothetical protein